MNKEIETAKEDLSFMNEGDYITRSMSNSKDILEEYIKQLEKDKEEAYWKGYVQKQKEAEEICKMCKYRNKYKEAKETLDKVTDKLKEFNKLLKQDGVYGYNKEINSVLNIIEEKKQTE